MNETPKSADHRVEDLPTFQHSNGVLTTRRVDIELLSISLKQVARGYRSLRSFLNEAFANEGHSWRPHAVAALVALATCQLASAWSQHLIGNAAFRSLFIVSVSYPAYYGTFFFLVWRKGNATLKNPDGTIDFNELRKRFVEFAATFGIAETLYAGLRWSSLFGLQVWLGFSAQSANLISQITLNIAWAFFIPILRQIAKTIARGR